MNNRVSVIVPNYNHAKYLSHRLESILNQTFQDFELILLDDYSSDNSWDVIMSYKDNSHISNIVKNGKNSGSSFLQWKKGLELAKGDLVWIAESDDYCEPTFLEELVKGFEQYSNIALAFCSSFFVDANDTVIRHGSSDYGGTLIRGGEFISNYQLFGNSIRNASAVVFDRKRAVRIGLDYTTYKAAGDYLFWNKMLEFGDVFFLKERLNYCREDGLNVTNKALSSGLTFDEDFRVHKYLCQKGYISSFKQKKDISLYYLDWMKSIHMDSRFSRYRLMLKWLLSSVC